MDSETDKQLINADIAMHEEVDSLSLEQMVREWRFAPVGHFIIGEPRSEYFQYRLRQLRTDHPDEWVAASKAVGW